MLLSLIQLQTEAIKPVLGKYYREPKKSAPLPFHLIGEFVRSLEKDHFVSDTGEWGCCVLSSRP